MNAYKRYFHFGETGICCLVGIVVSLTFTVVLWAALVARLVITLSLKVFFQQIQRDSGTADVRR